MAGRVFGKRMSPDGKRPVPRIGEEMRTNEDILRDVAYAVDYINEEYGSILEAGVVFDSGDKHPDALGITRSMLCGDGQAKDRIDIYGDRIARYFGTDPTCFGHICALQTVFHEVGHVKCRNLDSTPYGVPSRALSRYVLEESRDFYGRNWGAFVEEYECECEGFGGLREYLTGPCGISQKKADEYLIPAAQALLHSQWPKMEAFAFDRKFKDWAEFSGAMRDGYREFLDSAPARLYPDRNLPDRPLDLQCPDSWVQGMDLWKGEDSVWRPFFDDINNAPDLLTQQKRIASVTAYMWGTGQSFNSSLYQEHPCLAVYDLSPEAQFGRPFPEPPAFMKARYLDYSNRIHDWETHGVEETRPFDCRHPDAFTSHDGYSTGKFSEQTGEERNHVFDGDGPFEMDDWKENGHAKWLADFRQKRMAALSDLHAVMPLSSRFSYQEDGSFVKGDYGVSDRPDEVRKCLLSAGEMESMECPDAGMDFE